jgi:predicted transcriptional regulator
MPDETRKRERRYGPPVRIRLPDEAVRRVDMLAERAFRERMDQLRYLVLLGLEVEEQRQLDADNGGAKSVRK